ncbi:MAG: LamB/YcsF family protein [Propionibacteriaceae bacterium]|jgi:UPF0271 protein|nr:LamB/YcsF family protein [Propionibacteriaceae bacterium]
MYIDLNSDLGEAFGSWNMGDDAAMLAVVSSANVACGFHAGDPLVMRRTCIAAKLARVGVGAHPGYPDLVGFGRRRLDCSPEEVAADVAYQVAALLGVAKSVGAKVTHVKPHGALYNVIAKDALLATAVAKAIKEVAPQLPVLTLPGSAMVTAAQQVGIRVVTEAFADRAYNADGSLVDRRITGAVLHDIDLICERMVLLATEHVISAIDGTEIELSAQSICVHGDTPGAVRIAQAVRAALETAGVEVRGLGRRVVPL